DAQSAKSIANGSVQQAFAPEPPVKTWNQYLQDGAVKLGGTMLRAQDFEAQSKHLHNLIQAGVLMPLLIRRQSQLLIVSATYDWQPGDRLIYLFHDPKSKLLKLLSGQARSRLAIETIAAVETIPQPEPPPPAEPDSPVEPPSPVEPASPDTSKPEDSSETSASPVNAPAVTAIFPDNEAYIATSDARSD
ncbi:MAG: sodium:proton antiporter, partial [Cyanobacteriota bacterium SKYGB_h_bin112]|nr:sodium:proton antiporter [Cyanobacteriota bacterium SKYGB_h_bin112]